MKLSEQRGVSDRMAVARRRLPSVPAISFVLLACASSATAREVAVPIRFGHGFLRQRLIESVFTDPGQTARAWDDGTGCNQLVLSDPQVDRSGDRLRVRSRAAAHVATPLFGWCLFSIEWSGSLEMLEQATLDPDQPVVRFRAVDSNLLGEDGEKHVTGEIWDLAKSSVEPRFSSLTVDLRDALGELRSLLPLMLPRDDAAWTSIVVDSLRLAGVTAEDEGLRATLILNVPSRALPLEANPPPAPELTPEEIARWERSWQRWDAFLTYALKRAALDTDPARSDELRGELFATLVDARLDLLDALTPAAPGQPDPVRGLFVKTWERLAPVLEHLIAELPGENALKYLSFVAAADALNAIDELGPDGPLDISADGLRRMARIVGPEDPGDPLVYVTDVDPQLRELFGFGPPIEPPQDYPEEDLVSLLARFFVSEARAADETDSALGKRLHQWVPESSDLDRYLPLMRDLLRSVGGRTLDGNRLEPAFAEVYRRMVLATAWQESCWRQWVKEGGKVKPIESPVGSVGLMQINKAVWRGVYDLNGLAKDVAYNARAGAEILVHYLRDYAIKKGEHSVTGSVDNLARSTYAIYNGGPGHLKRYRDTRERADLKKIDELFWTKYQAVKAGRELEVAACLGGGA